MFWSAWLDNLLQFDLTYLPCRVMMRQTNKYAGSISRITGSALWVRYL